MVECAVVHGSRRKGLALNYFEHHIGDYDKNTAHLTACEDGIYHRMLRRYYDKERPLDSAVAEVQRVVRARTREEKNAVAAVLREFFRLEADGWHHDKCDEQLQDFFAGAPEREAKKANEENRLKRHREERARLFKIITDAGEHAPWNIQMKDLRAIVERITGEVPATQPATASGNAPATAPATQPATAPATPITATQTPIPNLQSPLPIDIEETSMGGKPPLPPGFLRFWTVWPKHSRKESRGECVKAWNKAGAEVIADAIVAHVERKKISQAWTKEGGEYIPAPLVYLNKRRWDGAEDDGAPGAGGAMAERKEWDGAR
ncbi:hypothetical protein D3C86_1416490 [compost metagenome]